MKHPGRIWTAFLAIGCSVPGEGDKIPSEASAQRMRIAFVLLAEARLPTSVEVEREFAAFAGEGEILELDGSSSDEYPRSQVQEFAMQPSGKAFVALVPLPVPNGEADDAARFSVPSFGSDWTPASHEAHLIVTLADSADTSAIERVRRMTAVLAAVAKASDAVGIYWGDAGATHPPEAFYTLARERSLMTWLMLWTGVSVAREADGRSSLLSLGLGQFDLPDLLLTAPSGDRGRALEVFFDLLAYLLERQSPIPEGDTVGFSESERWPVRYVQSPVAEGKRVWRVDVP